MKREIANGGVGSLHLNHILPANEVMGDCSILKCLKRGRKFHERAYVVHYLSILYPVCELHDNTMDMVAKPNPESRDLRGHEKSTVDQGAGACDCGESLPAVLPEY